jgi:hypothetical protein
MIEDSDAATDVAAACLLFGDIPWSLDSHMGRKRRKCV